MLQLLGLILGLILLVLAVAVAVWIIQWIVAIIVWICQAILLPVFIFLLPAVIALTILAGVYWGSWIAAKNYSASMRTNVKPEGRLGSFVRRSVVALQTVALTAVCVFFTAVSVTTLYASTMKGIGIVQGYYAAIEFPIFEIVFPFWKDM